jgi:PTH1 family peptidyl-tRNA hydrolase
MKLIVGLGNPGDKYIKTRHNMGFLVIDKLADKKQVVMRLENDFKSESGDFGDLENRVKLVKPQTFMNSSGESVSKLKNYYKIDTEDIWVVHDDIDLEAGKIRITLGGSSAGHKGVQSIIDQLGTNQFWRIRVGVGKSDIIPTEEWVLMNFENLDETSIIVDKTADYMVQSLSNGIKAESFNY